MKNMSAVKHGGGSKRDLDCFSALGPGLSDITDRTVDSDIDM